MGKQFKLFNLNLTIFFIRFFLMYNLLFNLFLLKKNFYFFSSNILNTESGSLNIYQYLNMNKYTSFITFFKSINYSLGFKMMIRNFKRFNIKLFITSNINVNYKLFFFLSKNNLVLLGLTNLYSNPWILYFPLVFTNLNLYVEVLFIGFVLNLYNLVYSHLFHNYLHFYNFKKFNLNFKKQFLLLN